MPARPVGRVAGWQVSLGWQQQVGIQQLNYYIPKRVFQKTLKLPSSYKDFVINILILRHAKYCFSETCNDPPSSQHPVLTFMYFKVDITVLSECKAAVESWWWCTISNWGSLYSQRIYGRMAEFRNSYLCWWDDKINIFWLEDKLHVVTLFYFQVYILWSIVEGKLVKLSNSEGYHFWAHTT